MCTQMEFSSKRFVTFFFQVSKMVFVLEILSEQMEGTF